MERYIKKSALVAEIERLKADALQKKSQCKRSGLERMMHQIGAYNKILSFLDTLKVKDIQEFPVSYKQSPVVLYGLTGSVGNTKEESQVKESAEIERDKETCKENGDSLTQEPVNDELEKAAKHYLYSNILYDDVYVGNPTDKDCIEMFKAGAQWQNEKDSIMSNDLEGLIDTLSKRYPEVSFAKLSRIAVRVAKWQKEQFEKERLKHCDELTDEQAQIESDFVAQHLKDNNRTPTFIDAIEYGMKMQKEQMMAKAVDGEVTYGKSLSIPSLGWVLDKKGLDYGDKVKLIIIKED